MYITQVATPAVRTGSFRQQMENIIEYKMIDHKMINYKIIDYKIIDHCQSVPGVHLVLGLCFLYLLCCHSLPLHRTYWSKSKCLCLPQDRYVIDLHFDSKVCHFGSKASHFGSKVYHFGCSQSCLPLMSVFKL